MSDSKEEPEENIISYPLQRVEIYRQVDTGASAKVKAPEKNQLDKNQGNSADGIRLLPVILSNRPPNTS